MEIFYLVMWYTSKCILAVCLFVCLKYPIINYPFGIYLKNCIQLEVCCKYIVKHSEIQIQSVWNNIMNMNEIAALANCLHLDFYKTKKNKQITFKNKSKYKCST